MSFKKLKRITSAFLFAMSLLVVSIILIAFVNKLFFLPIFGLFFLFWLSSLVFSFNLVLERREKIIIGLLVVIVTFSAVFFADSLKSYSDKSQELGSIQTQINDLTTQEAYALSYSEYFTKAIKQSEDNSLVLAQKISNFKVKPIEQPVYVVPDQPIILNYGDYEEDDD
jgi:hypothetical protein